MSIPFETQGGTQVMISLSLYTLPAYLYSINPNKVRKDLRDRIIAFQSETFKVINEYWHKGYAVNENKFDGKSIHHIVAGYQSQISQHNNKIETLQKELQAYKKLPVPANHFVKNSIDLEERIEYLLKLTEEELKREKDTWDFFQHRANTFVEYIRFLQIGGTEAQQFMINSIVKSGERASEAEQKYYNLKCKFEEFEKRINEVIQGANNLKGMFAVKS